MTLFFGPFGIIPAARNSSRERAHGRATGRYWKAFCLSLVGPTAVALIVIVTAVALSSTAAKPHRGSKTPPDSATVADDSSMCQGYQLSSTGQSEFVAWDLSGNFTEGTYTISTSDRNMQYVDYCRPDLTTAFDWWIYMSDGTTPIEQGDIPGCENTAVTNGRILSDHEQGADSVSTSTRRGAAYACLRTGTYVIAVKPDDLPNTAENWHEANLVVD